MKVPLFGIGLQGKSPKVTAQHRQNLYYEFKRDPDRTQVAVYGTPGLTKKLDLGDTKIRGMHELGDFYYVVHRGTFYQVTNAHVATSKGTLDTTTGNVIIKDNGSQIIVTDDGTAAYVYDVARDSFFKIYQVSTGTTTGTTSNKLVDSGGAFDTDGTKIGMVVYNTTDSTKATITAIDSATTLSLSADVFTSGEGYEIGPDGMVTPGSVDILDDYAIVGEDGTNKYQISINGNFADWDALDFSNADKRPDDIVRVFENNSELILFCEESTEFHVNTGFVDFPYRRLTSIEWGLAAKYSASKFENGVIFLARHDQLGEAILVQLIDHVPVRISDSDWENTINGYANIATATAFSYMLDGHAMYQINFAEGSWIYDGSTGVISEVKTTGQDRHLAENHIYFNKQDLVGSFTAGKVYELDKDVYTDDGEEIRRELRGKHIFGGDDNRIRIALLELLMESGVGLVTGQGEDPHVMLRYSRDGGHTWSNEQWRSFGKIGEYNERPRWRSLGVARDWVFEFAISDPVKIAITGTNVNAIVCRS